MINTQFFDLLIKHIFKLYDENNNLEFKFVFDYELNEFNQ